MAGVSYVRGQARDQVRARHGWVTLLFAAGTGAGSSGRLPWCLSVPPYQVLSGRQAAGTQEPDCLSSPGPVRPRSRRGSVRSRSSTDLLSAQVPALVPATLPARLPAQVPVPKSVGSPDPISGPVIGHFLVALWASLRLPWAPASNGFLAPVERVWWCRFWPLMSLLTWVVSDHGDCPESGMAGCV